MSTAEYQRRWRAAHGARVGVPNMATYPRAAVYLGSYAAGSSVTIRNCRFANGDNVNTLYIYADNIHVTDNVFTGTGVGASAFHDHSTYYGTTTVARGTQTVVGNSFDGAETFGTIAAIETHGGTQTVTGNTVTGYMAGGNLTGVASVATDGITCTGNTIIGALIGFALYAVTPASTPTRSVDVSHNQITIDRDLWTGMTGVGANTSSGLRLSLMSEAIEGLRIAYNTITYMPISSTVTSDNQGCGINLVNDATDEIRNLEIVGNIITRPIAAGIRIDMTVKRVKIADNITIDAACSTDASVAAIYAACIMLGHTVEDIDIHDNLYVDTRGTHIGNGHCVYSNPTAANGLCRAWNNQIRLLDGTAIVSPFYPAANTAGTSFWINENVPSDQVPFFNVKTGSLMTNNTTGKVQVQVTATAGTTWKVAAWLQRTTTTTAPGAGGAGALPATPAGYVTQNINGTDRQIPYY